MRDSGGVPAGANWAVLALMVSSAAWAAALSAAACFFAAFPLGFLASAWGGGSAQKNDAPWEEAVKLLKGSKLDYCQ